MTKAGFGHSSREAGCGRNHMMVAMSKLSQQLAKKHENSIFDRERGTKGDQEIKPSRIKFQSSCDKKHSPDSKQIQQHFAGSDHNCSVNVCRYIQYFLFFVWVQDRGEHGIYDCNIDCLHINSSHCTSSLNTNFRSSQCYIAGSFLTSLIFFSRFSATRISLISEGWRKNEAVPNYTLCLSE